MRNDKRWMGKPPWMSLIGPSPWCFPVILVRCHRQKCQPETSTGDMERRKMYDLWRSPSSSLFCSGCVSPLKTLWAEPRPCHYGQYHIMRLLSLADLNAVSLAVVIMMAGMTVYLPSKTMQTLSMSIISQKSLMFWAWFSSWFLSMW